MPKLYLIYILTKTTCHIATLVGSKIPHYMLILLENVAKLESPLKSSQ
jgi:hypothetical protein